MEHCNINCVCVCVCVCVCLYVSVFVCVCMCACECVCCEFLSESVSVRTNVYLKCVREHFNYVMCLLQYMLMLVCPYVCPKYACTYTLHFTCVDSAVSGHSPQRPCR